MKSLIGFVCLSALACSLAARAQDSGTCAAAFTAPVESGMKLAIGSRSAEIDIVGTEKNEIGITCTLGDPSRAGEVRIRFHRSGNTSQLEVRGGPDNNVHIVVQVPRKTDLQLHIPAGEIKVNNVVGDKDVEVWAGELIVSGVDPGTYRQVRASVGIGEVRATHYGIDKGGFLRSFDHSSDSGLYRLYAHVTTGEIELN